MGVARAQEMEDVKCTIDDIFALRQGERAELINGDMYMMAPPKTRHQRILMRLSHVIQSYIDRNHGSCEVFPAPFGVFLEDEDEDYVEPDISVICDPSKIQDDGCHGAPEWVIEIVSPSSRRMDCFIKVNLYRTAGVREYWIVDPKTERVRVYDFTRDDEQNYDFTDTIPAHIYEDLAIDMKKVTQS